MVFIRINNLDQELDIAGSLNKNETRDLTDEQLGLGEPVVGQFGSTASIISLIGDVVTITGLAGMSGVSAGRFITISGAASIGNNGTFLIIEFISSASVRYRNASAVAPDGYNGSIEWLERRPYSLADDLDFERTDRAAIKGTSYYQQIPTYERPTAVGTDVSANLSNIAGKTTDAKSVIVSRRFLGASVSLGNTFITITDTGNLPHADSVDRTGVPVFDGADAGDYDACFVEITNAADGNRVSVLTGGSIGNIVFGVTRAGSSTDGNSVEILFRSVSPTGAFSSSIAYTWESGQPSSVNLRYGFRSRLDLASETSFRDYLEPGTGGTGGGGPAVHASLRELIHLADGAGGPFEDFLSGAFREILPTGDPFPTSVVWYEASDKIKKIVQKTIARNSKKIPTSVSWTVFDTDGSTIITTITDTISYSGVIETSRVRTIS